MNAALDDWTRFDRPEVDRVYVSHDGEMDSIQLAVEGIRCSACAGNIERHLREVAGVRNVQVAVSTGRVEVGWTHGSTQLSSLLALLARLGYRPHPLGSASAREAATLERRAALKRLLVAGLGMMQVMTFAFALYAANDYVMDSAIDGLLRWISLATTAPVVAYAGWPFLSGAWRNIRDRHLGMDVPVALGVLLAFGASLFNTWHGSGTVYYDSVTMFIFFLSIARFVELRARHNAATLSDALALLLPPQATRIVDGKTTRVAIAALKPGDRVLVPRGEAAPTDGRIAEGDTRFDESLLTGESLPVTRRARATVIAGAINLDRPIEMIVTATGQETVLAGIVRLLERARSLRPRLAQAADRYARWFVGGLLVATALVAGTWLLIEPARAFEATLAMLVITCPCALALATPAAISAAIGALSRAGVLVTRPDAIEGLAVARHILFDKTGTLTAGPSAIRSTEVLGSVTAERARVIAAALERHSSHPVAAVFRDFEDAAVLATDVQEEAGIGVHGVIDGRRYRLGRLSFAVQSSNPPPAGRTNRIWLACENEILAAFDIDDRLRPGSRAVVDDLRSLGLEPEIASGDDNERVAALAAELGIERYAGRLSPRDKLDRVRSLQETSGGAIMVGDGINDAPVLAVAGVSVALQSGTALAQASSDLVLVRSDLGALPRAVEVARRCRRIVRQNLAWAAFYNAVAIPFAAMGWVAPGVAAIGMSLSSILVVLNAQRIGWTGRSPS